MVIFLSALLAATAGTPFELATAEAPLIIVQAKVNGVGPFRFILDTGASGSEVTPATAKKAGLTGTEKAKAVGAGGSVEVELASGATLEVGGVVVKNLTVAVVENKEVMEVVGSVDGIVGFDFLKNFVVTIDYPRRVVRFEATKARGPARASAQ